MREAVERARQRHAARRVEQAERERIAQMPRIAALARELANVDTPCPTCGYNLRGVRAEVCPECGRDILRLLGRKPRVRPPRRPVSWWGLGGGAVNLALLVAAGWRVLNALEAAYGVSGDRDLKWNLVAMAVSFCSLLVWIGGPWQNSALVERRVLAVYGMGAASGLCLYGGWG